MKKLRLFVMLIICIVFLYVAVEQWMGVGTLFNNYNYKSIPVSAIAEASQPIETNVPEIILNVKIEAGQAEDQAEQPADNDVFAQDDMVRIIVSAAGDCILGFDEAFGFAGSFMDEFERQDGDYSYFLRNFSGLFQSSDLTIINLEVPLTNSILKAEKEFVFKGLPEFTEILKSGNVDAVTVANNHTKDYLLEGYYETIGHLEEAGLLYFGNEYTALTEVKGIKIGMFGYSAWYIDNGIKNNIVREITKLREMGADLVIAYFHWGEERAPLPNDIQKAYAYFTIDNGADLVLGSHPHVIQGIEEYKGKQIVYSFGNFCYGGAKNPSDKDTFVFQQTFSFSDGKLLNDADIRIIPASISSLTNRNNYQPTPLSGDDYLRVMQKIIERSESFNSKDTIEQAILR